MKNNIFINTLLLLGSLVFVPLALVGFIYTTIKHIVKMDYSVNKQFAPILKLFALLLDGLANAMAGEFLNDILLKKRFGKKYKYGKWYDTISEVTGVNEERKTLKKLGLKLSKFLSLVLNKNHCIEAINRDRPYPASKNKKRPKGKKTTSIIIILILLILIWL